MNGSVGVGGYRRGQRAPGTTGGAALGVRARDRTGDVPRRRPAPRGRRGVQRRAPHVTPADPRRAAGAHQGPRPRRPAPQRRAALRCGAARAEARRGRQVRAGRGHAPAGAPPRSTPTTATGCGCWPRPGTPTRAAPRPRRWCARCSTPSSTRCRAARRWPPAVPPGRSVASPVTSPRAGVLPGATPSGSRPAWPSGSPPTTPLPTTAPSWCGSRCGSRPTRRSWSPARSGSGPPGPRRAEPAPPLRRRPALDRVAAPGPATASATGPAPTPPSRCGPRPRPGRSLDRLLELAGARRDHPRHRRAGLAARPRRRGPGRPRGRRALAAQPRPRPHRRDGARPGRRPTPREAAAAARACSGRRRCSPSSWQVALHGDPLTEEEMDQLACAGGPILKLRGSWTVVDPAVARKARKRLVRTVKPGPALAATLTGVVQIDPDGTATSDEQVVVGASLLTVREQLRQRRDPRPRRRPAPALRATLRDYQRHGLTWLAELTDARARRLPGRRHGAGQDGHPDRAPPAPPRARPAHGPDAGRLPGSLLGNWEAEIERFAPGVAVRRFHGGAPRRSAALRDGFVLTTYGTMRRDAALLAEVGVGPRGRRRGPARQEPPLRPPPGRCARSRAGPGSRSPAPPSRTTSPSCGRSSTGRPRACSAAATPSARCGRRRSSPGLEPDQGARSSPT